MKSFNFSWVLHGHLVPWKATSIKTLDHKECTEVTEHPRLTQANKLLGFRPATDEQSEGSKGERKLQPLNISTQLTTQKGGPAQKNNQEPGNG